MTVEEEGVRRWLLAQGRTADLTERIVQQQRYVAVVDLLRHTRTELRTLYASGIDPQHMRDQKHATFAALRDSYARLTEKWKVSPFASWFAGEVNNAHLASVATYYDCVPGFERELAAVGGDLNAFYRRVRTLAKLDQATRDAVVCAKP
jgi:predicted aminopeptidase